MKLTYRSASHRYHTHLARVLASVLFVGIIYSATFGAVHSHLNATYGPDASISKSTAAQTGISAMPLHITADGNECLVCVLHRQFSSSTVHTPIFIVGPSTQTVSLTAPTVFYYSSLSISRPIARQSGRAPPRDLA